MPDLQSELKRARLELKGTETQPAMPVAPSILALYNHEGWKAAHDAATVEWVITKLNEPKYGELFDIGDYARQRTDVVGERFCEVLEQEIPYAKLIKNDLHPEETSGDCTA